MAICGNLKAPVRLFLADGVGSLSILCYANLSWHFFRSLASVASLSSHEPLKVCRTNPMNPRNPFSMNSPGARLAQNSPRLSISTERRKAGRRYPLDIELGMQIHGTDSACGCEVSRPVSRRRRAMRKPLRYRACFFTGPPARKPSKRWYRAWGDTPANGSRPSRRRRTTEMSLSFK